MFVMYVHEVPPGPYARTMDEELRTLTERVRTEVGGGAAGYERERDMLARVLN